MIPFFQAISSGKQIDTSPIKVLIIGDSIASGTSNGVGNATEGTLFQWTGNLFEIENDIIGANTGSPYPAMADRLFTLTKRPMHLLEYGSGGADFSPNGDNNNWSESGSLYSSMIADRNTYYNAFKTDKVDIVRITLGINDARGFVSLSQIEADAIDLIDRLTIDFPSAKIVINQLGKGSNDAIRYNAVREYISNLISNYSNLYAGKDLNDYASALYYDGLHLNQEGNDLLGIADAEIINKLL